METGIGIIIYWGNTQSDFFIIYLLSVFFDKDVIKEVIKVS